MLADKLLQTVSATSRLIDLSCDKNRNLQNLQKCLILQYELLRRGISIIDSDNYWRYKVRTWYTPPMSQERSGWSFYAKCRLPPGNTLLGRDGTYSGRSVVNRVSLDDVTFFMYEPIFYLDAPVGYAKKYWLAGKITDNQVPVYQLSVWKDEQSNRESTDASAKCSSGGESQRAT